MSEYNGSNGSWSGRTLPASAWLGMDLTGGMGLTAAICHHRSPVVGILATVFEAVAVPVVGRAWTFDFRKAMDEGNAEVCHPPIAP